MVFFFDFLWTLNLVLLWERAALVKVDVSIFAYLFCTFFNAYTFPLSKDYISLVFWYFVERVLQNINLN